MMDDISRYNRDRWNELARLGVEFARPWMGLDARQARSLVDPYSQLGDMAGKEVLCLAGGGGQQSLAFALLGARVTVLDLSDEMLAIDQAAAHRFQYTIRYEQGDMRDLARFADHSYDIIWHAYSLNFVPSLEPVFDEVARVIRPGGVYAAQFHNPFTFGLDERAWNGEGYALRLPYAPGGEAPDPLWDILTREGISKQVAGPREFRHTLGDILNGLVRRKFILLGLWEEVDPDVQAAPGTWEHFLSVCVPILQIWMRFQPNQAPS